MTTQPPLRADAQRNRERMLAAAERVFQAKGAGASLEDVAKEAGVGIGTLYRRFPTREELFAAVFSDKFLAFAERWRAREGELAPDKALRVYLVELIVQTNIYRDLAASVGTVLQSQTPGCDANARVAQQLLHSAKRAGLVRKEVSYDDIVVVITAVCLAAGQGANAKTRIRRLVDLFLGGILRPQAEAV
ncbi:TetR/AcrR family transcriptional regulator [Pseudoxanthomonas sp. JBR18]|uniref:TetR/AcrR family transcriptional regulator n=1 Tax=Pseudoxanthomonas sp. JBR18 TaxID=2969308 RepID=UPI002305E5F5|nr:TetR/AcrR family transcriptional regulator [Pseudoxanthomonas sp. JBR18]WCE06258.1 helix-turn-helix domain containing protein [Pseudoxanthomonas sp. JBR18]